MWFRRGRVSGLRMLGLATLLSLFLGCQSQFPSQEPRPSQVPSPSEAPSLVPAGKIVVGVHIGEDATGSLPGFLASDMPLFPILANGHFLDRAVRRFVYSGVYRYDHQAAPVPDLASVPCTWSRDLLDITCQLLSAQFHDGTPLTASDVAFTFQLRASDACVEEGQEFCVPNLATAVAANDHTVVFHLSQPDATFLTVALPQVLIESKRLIEASYAKFKAGSRDAKVALLAAEAANIKTALKRANPDCEQLAVEAETEVSALGLEPWSRSEFSLGPNDRFNACGYVEYLARVLGDAHDSLNREGVDAIAAAYRVLDYQDDRPIGSGPWMVRALTPGKQMDLDAFGAFHRGRAATAALEVRLLRTKPDAVSAVRNRDVDWLLQPYVGQSPNFIVDGLDGVEDGLTLAEYDDPSWFALHYNLRHGALFADARLREAMELCIDKEETVAAATREKFHPIESPVLPSSWAYNKDLEAPIRNVDAATQRLVEAGWKLGSDGVFAKDGRRLSAKVPVRKERPDRLMFLRLLEVQVRDCGMEIIPLPLDPDPFGAVLYWPHLLPGTDQQWDLVFSGLINTGTPDPGINDPVFLSSEVSTATNQDGENMAGYSNPEIDALLDKARSTYEIPARARLYREYQEILAKDRPMLFAWAPRLVEVRSSRLTSVDGPLPESSATWWWELEKLALVGAR
jgi:ABC-type transport system substrate-binding protein